MKFEFYVVDVTRLDSTQYGWRLWSGTRIVAGDMHQGYERITTMIAILRRICADSPALMTALEKEVKRSQHLPLSVELLRPKGKKS